MPQDFSITETGNPMFINTDMAQLFAHVALRYGVPKPNGVYRISQ
jgi:hypothetical protein